ncbi:hypothetical protein [Streptomyces sp. NPDC059881]|uniref:hypothetical protein n=1 Tax=Streptomyces sp. NPDC059881 TaxID=3346986 RepID=UPI0036484153
MTTDPVQPPVRVACDCGSTDVRTVEAARTHKGAMRKELYSRPAKGPEKSGDGCLHFVEGVVISLAAGGGLAYTGVDQDKPLYVLGGVVLAALILAGTLFVVRDDSREKAAEQAGEARADQLWRPAHYCAACESVFCPGGRPWAGRLTPEQFKKLVWTRAGYGDQLAPGDKAKDAVLPERFVAEP